MSKWVWTVQDENTESKIHKLYYAYSLEDSPPIYVLFAQMRNGDMKKFSLLNPKEFPDDTAAFEAAEGKPFEIPVPIPDPSKKRERGPSCSLM